MKTITIFSILSLFVIAFSLATAPAFADHATASVSAPAGTSVPGCEETNECYIPYEVTIDVGGEVTWTNDDTAAHTVTSGSAADGPDGLFDSSLFMAGSTFSVKFDGYEPGNYNYFCMVHPWMEGIVVVQETSAEEKEETHEEEEEMHEEETMMELPEGAVEGLEIGNTALWVEISGDKVYVSNPDEGTIHVIDANTNKVVNTIQSMVGVTVLEVVEDKNKLYASVMEHAPIQVYDLTTGESLGEIDIGEPIVTQWSKADKNYGQREYIHIQTNAIGLKYNPNTELLYAAHSTVNHVNIIDTNTDQDLGDIPVGKTPLMIEIDQERNIGYVTNWETNNVSVLDLESNEEVKTLNTGFVPDQMEIDYDNNRLYVTHHGSPHVSVIDLRTQEIETKMQLDGPTHALALDTANDLLHVTYLPESGVTGPGLPGKVEFIDTSTNQIVGDFSIPDNPFIIDIDSENQKLYASIVEDGIIFIVDLAIDPDYQEIVIQTEESMESAEESMESAEESMESAEEAEEGGGCLIATAAYGSELAPQVQFLREIRDNTVMNTPSGAAFMTGFNQLYYSFSPTIADLERENPMFQEAVRVFITPMISTLSIMTLADEDSESSVLGLGISVIALNLGMYIAAPAAVAFTIRKYLKSRK